MLLFITPGCIHCPVVLQGLSELVKQTLIGKLTVVNVAAHPELVKEYGVRAAPWLMLGPFTLTSAQTPAELKHLKLADCEWVASHLNVLITGATGVGKTWLARWRTKPAVKDTTRITSGYR